MSDPGGTFLFNAFSLSFFHHSEKAFEKNQGSLLVRFHPSRELVYVGYFIRSWVSFYLLSRKDLLIDRLVSLSVTGSFNDVTSFSRPRGTAGPGLGIHSI